MLTQLEITSRKTVLDGKLYGAVGAYTDRNLLFGGAAAKVGVYQLFVGWICHSKTAVLCDVYFKCSYWQTSERAGCRAYCVIVS